MEDKEIVFKIEIKYSRFGYHDILITDINQIQELADYIDGFFFILFNGKFAINPVGFFENEFIDIKEPDLFLTVYSFRLSTLIECYYTTGSVIEKLYDHIIEGINRIIIINNEKGLKLEWKKL